MLSGWCDDRGGSSRSGCSIFDGAPGLPRHHRCRVSRKEGPFSRELPTRHEIKQGHTPRSYRFDAIAAWHCTARQHSTTQPQFIEVTHRTAHFLRARSREACRLATLAALLQQEAACRHKKGTSRIIGSNHLQHMAL